MSEFGFPWKQTLRNRSESKHSVWDRIPGNTGGRHWEVRPKGRQLVRGVFSSRSPLEANEDEFHWETRGVRTVSTFLTYVPQRMRELGHSYTAFQQSLVEAWRFQFALLAEHTERHLLGCPEMVRLQETQVGRCPIHLKPRL